MPQTTNHTLPVIKYKPHPQTANHKLKNTNHIPQTTSHETKFLFFVVVRRELREKHAPEALKASRDAHEANKSKLKSDLKKTTAFTKKVGEEPVG